MKNIMYQILLHLFISVVGGVIAGLIVTENFKRALKNIASKEQLKKIVKSEIALIVSIIFVIVIFNILVSKGIINFPREPISFFPGQEVSSDGTFRLQFPPKSGKLIYIDEEGKQHTITCNTIGQDTAVLKQTDSIGFTNDKSN